MAAANCTLSSRENYAKILKIQERTELFSLHKEGWRIPALAKKFTRSQGWVKYWISGSKREKVLTDLPKSGRPSKLKSAKAMKLPQNTKYKWEIQNV